MKGNNACLCWISLDVSMCFLRCPVCRSHLFVYLPEAFRFLLHLKADLVAASSVLLVLHRADYSCKALDALDQCFLVFPLR